LLEYAERRERHSEETAHLGTRAWLAPRPHDAVHTANERTRAMARFPNGSASTTDAEFVALAHTDELWDGEMESYDVDGTEVLLVRVGEEFLAYDGVCPHQEARLVDGELDGTTLTCDAHGWCFDVSTGEGISPHNTTLVRYPVRVAGDIVEVCTAPATP
jgi:toluene monooxygenase system ferredoxin subunit